MQTLLNIALSGMGQMGQAIERIAVEQGHEVVARFDLDAPVPDSIRGFEGADVIDFTSPSAVLEHIQGYCKAGIPAVIGTTGWYDALPLVEAWVAEHDATVLYAPNFSIGVALLVEAVRAVAPYLNALPEYDVFVHEAHHTNKIDSPSGTALHLAKQILRGMERKTRIEVEAQHGRIAPDALHVSSTRVGHVFGRHEVGIDGVYDQISLIHDAKSRNGFAYGAIRAAGWIQGRKGLFTLDDVLADWLAGASSTT